MKMVELDGEVGKATWGSGKCYGDHKYIIRMPYFRIKISNKITNKNS